MSGVRAPVPGPRAARPVLVEQGAQIDEDLLGRAFDIDREVKTDGIGTEAAWPLAIGRHLGSRGGLKARVDAWALVSGIACKDQPIAFRRALPDRFECRWQL